MVPISLFVAVALVFVALYRVTRSATGKLSSLPWLGLESDSWFGLVRARLHNVKHFRRICREAFHAYSRNGKAYVVPLLSNDLVVLPPSEIDWLISQPDSALSADEPHYDSLQTDYTLVDPYIARNHTHHAVITRDLTRRLGDLTEDIIDELGASIDDEWGKDVTEWKEVVPYDTMMRVVARTSNRIFVGLPLCRAPEVLENGKGFATQVPMNAFILRQMPVWLRPVAAKFVTYKNKQYTRNFINFLRPTILARQAALSKGEKSSEPNDFLQWVIRTAAQSGLPAENDPFIIAGRVLALNFAAIHTSTFSITNAVFDIVSPPSSHAVIDELIQEIESVLAANNGVWTKQGLAQMYKIDSTLRESSRLGSFLTVGLGRKVMAPEGLTSPISKTYLPKGTMVAFPTNGIHNSEEIYPDTDIFKPFRFSDQRSTEAPVPNGDAEKQEATTDELAYLKKANLAFVSTSASYHPWGHGRHACPGRFFAANELKLLLAYLVTHYDFEMLDKRPDNLWLGTSKLPPMKASIRVRRKKGTV